MILSPQVTKQKGIPPSKPQRKESTDVITPPKTFTLTKSHFVWLTIQQQEKNWLVSEKNGHPLISSKHPIEALYITVKKILDINQQATIYYDLQISQAIYYFEEMLRKDNQTRNNSLYTKLMFIKDVPIRKQRQAKNYMSTSRFLEWCREKKKQ